jgi:hypothetical protein
MNTAQSSLTSTGAMVLAVGGLARARPRSVVFQMRKDAAAF